MMENAILIGTEYAIALRIEREKLVDTLEEYLQIRRLDEEIRITKKVIKSIEVGIGYKDKQRGVNPQGEQR